jgi:hypothetical protein
MDWSLEYSAQPYEVRFQPPAELWVRGYGILALVLPPLLVPFDDDF